MNSKKAYIVVLVLVMLFICIGVFIFLEKRESDLKVVILSPRASFLNSTQKIFAKVKPSLEKMIMDAERDGVCLVVTSGYRTYEQQVKLYREATDKSLVAIPGTSEHELGSAVDLGGCPMANGIRDDSAERVELRKPFGELAEYQWLVTHGLEYGFSQSLKNEPWHWYQKYTYEI